MLDYTNPNVDKDDIVFENRNKDYGAFIIRQLNGKTSLRATIAAIAIVLLLLIGPLIAEAYLLNTAPVLLVIDPSIHTIVLPPVERPKEIIMPKIAAPSVKVKSERFVEFKVERDDMVDEETPDMAVIKNNTISNRKSDGELSLDPNLEVPEGPIGKGDGNIIESAPEKILDLSEITEYPAFPGGDEAMVKYLQSVIKFPNSAILANKQGKVFLEILIEQDGTISDVKIVRGMGYGLDQEAERAVRTMPKWTPGKYNGNAVRVKMNIPIAFTLAD
jgi:periplasmic protein TonB